MSNRYLELSLKEIPKDKENEPAKVIKSLALFHEIDPQIINAFVEMILKSEHGIGPLDISSEQIMRQEAIEAINNSTLIGVHMFQGTDIINLQLIMKRL